MPRMKGVDPASGRRPSLGQEPGRGKHDNTLPDYVAREQSTINLMKRFREEIGEIERMLH